jgi:hypothetical protein
MGEDGEDYLDVLQDIKILKENHILLRENFKAPSAFFKEIGSKLQNKLNQAPSVAQIWEQNANTSKNEVLENFAETLIYERIGSYLLKQLVSLYLPDELDFRSRAFKLHELYMRDLQAFNELFQSELPADLTPSKSALMCKLFFRCQLPFEMYHTLHETAVMATEELSLYYQKPKNTFDAQTLLPYLILVLLKSFSDLYADTKPSSDVSQDDQNQINLDYQLPQSPIDKHRDGFRVRLLLMEHFTVHAIGMSRQDYSFVTFKEVEKVILEIQI